MAQFSSLPNEIVGEILKLIQPEDLENFAQSSRHVFWLASPFLTKHRALIRKYRTFSNDKSSGSITDLLSAVIAQPRIGHYVKRLELGPLMEPDIDDSANLYNKAELESFTTAALDSECLKRLSEQVVLDEREFWSKEIQGGTEDILLAILLPLLPNLAAFSAQAPSTQFFWYDSTIEQAASATRPTLCKLAHISLNPQYGDGFHIADIQRISGLPSVRVLTAPRAFGMDGGNEMSTDTMSNTIHLKLWESCIDPQVVGKFLGGFQKLQSFTYSCLYLLDGNSHDPFSIRSSLLAHCKSTLRSLTLLAPGHSDFPFMGSLRGFETLKEVYTEWSSLILETRGSGGPRLNEHLPASLVRLKIHDSEGRGKSEYERVIESAQYAKEHRLQKLEWLAFGGIRLKWSLNTFDRGLRETCLNMGLSLVFSPYAPESED